MWVSTSSIGGRRRLGSAAKCARMAASAPGVDLARRARGGGHPQHHVAIVARPRSGRRGLPAPGKTWAVDDQGGRQALVGEPVGGERGVEGSGVDRGLDGIGERIDQARLAGAGLARHQNADRLGLARLGGGQVAREAAVTCVAQLLG